MERDEALRAFFAVELSAALREQASGVRDALRQRLDSGVSVRWTRPEAWHVTLRFLGDCEPGRLSEIVAAARAALAALAPFELRLGEAIAFPQSRARVLALDCLPHPLLVAAAAALERAATDCGFEPESRTFKPHVTLGRVVRGRLRAREIADVPGVAEIDAAAQHVREVVLFRSDLARSGARYTPLERIALGGDVHP